MDEELVEMLPEDKYMPDQRLRRARWQDTFAYSSFLVVLLLSILALLAYSTRGYLRPLEALFKSTTASETVWEDCGSTPSEARKRGCHFDILSFAWQTPECYDHVNTEAFRMHNKEKRWSYFADVNNETSVPEDLAMRGERAMFVTGEYHFTHCTYMWRQLHRAYSVLGYIDEHLENWNHTLHCQHVLLQGLDKYGESMADINTIGRIIYPRCRKIGHFSQHLSNPVIPHYSSHQDDS